MDHRGRSLNRVSGLGGAVPWVAQEIGDLDADGRPEIAFAPGDLLDDDGATNRGALYVLYPEAIPVPEPGFLLGIVSGITFLGAIGRKRLRS